MSQSSATPQRFHSRSKRFRRERCAHCRIPFPHCICRFTPRLSLPFDVLVLTHAEEMQKPTSTGYQLHRCMPSQLRVWERKVPLNLTKLPEACYVIHPGEGAADPGVLQSAIGEDKGPLVIWLDGTWKQAAKMWNLTPELKRIRRIAIKAEHSSQFLLRRQQGADHLSTLESAVHLLHQLRLDQPALLLEAYFQVWQSVYLQTKQNKRELHWPPELVRLQG